MLATILFGSVALVASIVGCIVIWGLDARRADEIKEQPAPDRRASGSGAPDRATSIETRRRATPLPKAGR